MDSGMQEWRILWNMKINEIFKSVQGEGLLMGVPTLFIRTAGCDLRCVWCDTPYALLESQGTEWSLDAIISETERHGTSDVCLTGGDPLMQMDDSLKLIAALIAKGYRVLLETSGAYPIEHMPFTERLIISMDLKLPGSGMEDRNRFENISFLRKWDQLKFIIAGRKDYDYAKRLLSEYDIHCEVIATPVGGKDLRWLAERVLEDNLKIRVLPQMHKYIWGDERGR
jgi:7-carboxy-7-deazaguanine synthase